MAVRHMSPLVFAGVASLAAMAGCTSVTAPSQSEATVHTLPVRSVAEPAVRTSPFCAAMAELSAQLDDPSVDSRAAVIEAYTAMRPDVPAEILEDFETVLAQLQGATETSEVDEALVEVDAENIVEGDGLAIPTTPVDRLNAYVAQACRDVGNNPGPPATEPP